jgi:peptide/nickel transport system permease protein
VAERVARGGLRLLKHLSSGAVTLVLVSVIVFVAMRAIPGRYEQIILGPFGTAQARYNLSVRFGLNQPLPVQYLKWLWSLLHGNFGSSLTSQQPIRPELFARFGVNVELVVIALVVAILVGIPLGVITAVNHDRKLPQWIGRGLGALGISIPDFVAASLALLLFSTYSLGLRVTGWVPIQQGILPNLQSALIPALVLAMFITSITIRTTRDAALGVLAEPYITAAAARGESRLGIIRHHVLRNASLPVVTVLITQAGYALGGSVLIEQVFTIPGLGNYLFEAVNDRDYGVVQAVCLLAAFIFVVCSIAGDQLCAWLDPRIMSGRAA